MAPEPIRLPLDTSTPSQIGTNIETLFDAIDKLQKAKEERVNKYQKESTELLQTAAKELQATADAARAMQKIKELQAKETQFEEEKKAIDYMIKTINRQIDSLSDSNPEEVIKVLEKRIDELQKRSDETDTKEKEFKSEIKTLQGKKRKLEARIKPPQPAAAQKSTPRGTVKKKRKR